MHTSTSPGRFDLPRPSVPNSPPTTPEPSTSKSPSETSYRAFFQRVNRNGVVGVDLEPSPPEHLEPVNGHKFSYTPPQRKSPSSSSEDPNEASDADESEVELPTSSPIPERRKSVHVRPIDESKDFTVEEMSENDMGYDTDTEVLHPFHCEDAQSEIDTQEIAAEEEHVLIDDFENLRCDIQSDEPSQKERVAQQERDREFNEAQRQRYLKKKKRWIEGGSHKRSHEQSVGSSSENDDCHPLDSQESGPNTRRLRRRTQAPDEERPRKSQLFDDTPAEIEELKFIGEGPIQLLDDETFVGAISDQSTDEELIYPPWLEDMDLDRQSPIVS